MMKKNINKVVVVCLFIIIILIVVLILFNKIKKIEIPDNPNLKIEVDMGGAPVSIITYYFYDDSIIETSYSGGVLSTGPVSYTITTKYHFNEKVDLTELMEFLNQFSKNTDDIGDIRVTLDSGESYFIDENSFADYNGVRVPLEICTRIFRITDKAYKKDSYEERN